MNAFVAAAEQLLYYGSKLLRTDISTYCDLAARVGDDILGTNEGDLLSGIEIEGFRDAVGPDEFESLMKGLHLALQTRLGRRGHSFEFFIGVDPDGAEAVLARQRDLQLASAARIGIDVGDMIESNHQAVAKHVAHERVYLGLWTSPLVLSSAERKEKRDGSGVPYKPLVDQPLGDQSQGLVDVHEGFVKAVIENFKNAGVICRKLSAHEVLRAARMEIDPEFTAPDWTPRLNGDPNPLRKGLLVDKTPGDDVDFSDLLALPIESQMFPRGGERVNSRHLRIGDRVYAPIYVDVPPKEVMPFDALYERLAQESIPWRMKIRIDGGGGDFLTLKKLMAKIMVIGDSSAKIRDSFDAMDDVEFAGGIKVHLKIAFATWAPAGDLKRLVRNASKLAAAVQGWGGCDVCDAPGDQTLGFISSVPFVSKSMGAAGAVGPLGHAIRMLPVTRPYAPWRTGSVMYRTMDGKPFPFEPGSGLQSTWVYLVAGRPGYGKSVSCFSTLLAGAIRPGLARLPFMSILDIGPSGIYFADSLRESLPEDKKHLVGAWTLRNDPDKAVNVLDLPLGCTEPLSEHRNFLVNFITKAVTPPGESAAGEMSALVSLMTTHVYRNLNGAGMRDYEPGIESIVDDEIARIGLGELEEYRHKLKWRHVVDHLFANGSIRAAILAQRYAVPTLEDFAQIPEEIIKEYKEATTEYGGSLIDTFRRGLKAALTEYRILGGRTKFDIGEVRVAALNLEPSCGTKGTPEGDKRTALMYMLGQYILTKDYRLDNDRVKEMKCPEQYRVFHFARVDDIKNDLKWEVMDEFHRGANSIEVVNVVEQDCREGRKYNICVLLASQELRDYPDIICRLATGTFIMDMKEGEDGEAIAQKYDLPRSVTEMAMAHVKGSTSKGVPFLAIMSVKGQKNMARVLVSTLGPACLWGLATGAEDAQVREIVARAVGGRKARTLLAKYLPGMAEARVKALKSAGETTPIQRVAQEVIEKVGLV